MAASPVTTFTAAPPPLAVAMPGDVAHRIDSDVQPCTHIAAPAARGNCYWARLKGGDGLDNIIDKGNSSGQVVVTIRQGDKLFTSCGCGDSGRR